MTINQEEEKRQQIMVNFYTTTSHKHKMRQKMWEDQATADQANRFSEATRGQRQEGVTNKK
jgi:hypothetical protein